MLSIHFGILVEGSKINFAPGSFPKQCWIIFLVSTCVGPFTGNAFKSEIQELNSYIFTIRAVILMANAFLKHSAWRIPLLLPHFPILKQDFSFLPFLDATFQFLISSLLSLSVRPQEPWGIYCCMGYMLGVVR